MTPATAATAPHSGTATSWFGRAERWLDDRGKGAWIAAIVVGFIVFWPIGLALLAYMIWSNRMFSGKCSTRKMNRSFGPMAYRPTGNTAFDAYRSETLRRLEDEQEAFQAFLDRLREAKDQSEFDAFMSDRAKSRNTGADHDNSDNGPKADA